MTGFSMKCNTVLKWFKRISIINKSVKNGFQMVVNTDLFPVRPFSWALILFDKSECFTSSNSQLVNF